MKEDKELNEDELVQKVLSDALSYSPLVQRIGSFQGRKWFITLQGLKRPVTFEDLVELSGKSVVKTFAYDAFKKIVQEYFIAKRTGNYHCWVGLPSDSLAGKNKRGVNVTSTFVEFNTPGGIFHFTYPDLMIYRWHDNTVKPEYIMKARYDLTVEDIPETLDKLDEIRRQLESTNRLALSVREFIFARDVETIEDLTGINMQIAVPADCPIQHSSLIRVPVAQNLVEKTVAQMFNRQLELTTSADKPI